MSSSILDLETEPELCVGEAAQGEAAAPARDFEAIYDEHFAFVWRSARRLGVSEASASDVAQEVFLIVLRRLSSFEGRSSLKTWLFGILIGVVRNHRRSRRRERAVLEPTSTFEREPTAPANDPDPHASAAKAEAVRLLYEMLDELDDDKREVFVLAELEQFTAPAIAEALGVNLNTVYSRLRAARRAFEDAVARRRARDEWRVR